ncbi:hypothetical protein [Terrisporobacter sp.]|uniref:hypothetical protein n=1 Tax=Terrisporobacter sp. TaxID=1965305 RepID=UPI00261A2951|nr:hypothetical protein [Terrisporobacter sp.]
MSFFILSIIVFIITSSLHNSLYLLNKNKDNIEMLSIAKEFIEDERAKIKNDDIIQSYSNIEKINKYTIYTTVSNTNYYKCYSLNVKVVDKNNSMELNTYVTKK